MKYIIFSLLFVGCAAQPQFIEIVDLWEPDWLFDCLEEGIPGEECNPPSEKKFCPAHYRVMTDESR